MPVYSMTGYATAQAEGTGASPESSGRASPVRRLALEIRSVNSRFLDLGFRLPDELRALEPALRSLVTARIRRGKVEVRATLEQAEGASVPEPSARLLQRLASAQDSIRAWLPEAPPLSVADALRLCSSAGSGGQDWSTLALPVAEQALAALLEARAQEGARLAAMLQGHVQQLQQLAAQAAPLVPQLVEQQRQRFMERWTEALGLGGPGAVTPEAARERALSEATAFAIRIDVAEELTRLQSHLDEIGRLLKKGGDIGKRLDFLIQELHREANTLGSKSDALELTRISVAMKALIAHMREKVQNIE